MEEDNKKLKQNVDRITKEKTTLLEQLMKTNVSSDLIESKIETEIHELKDTLLAELSDLKSQVGKSMTFTRSRLSLNQSATQELPSNADGQEQTETNDSSVQYQFASGKVYSAFIVGDSMTSILSRNKLSDTDLQVTIKSHVGGRLQDLHNTIIRIAENDAEFICSADAILIHGGTNNLSDGDSPKSVTDQFEHMAETVKQINPECQIVISSILPRKNDKLANQLIKQTNESLKQLCDSKPYILMDNYEKLLANAVPNVTLYKDSIHLNAKGGKIFGEAISQTLRKVFNLAQHSTQTSDEQEQDFQYGRIPGRSLPNNRNHVNKNLNNRNNNNRHNHNRSLRNNYQNNYRNNTNQSKNNNRNYQHNQNNKVRNNNKTNNNRYNNNQSNGSWNNNNQNNKNCSQNWNGNQIPMMFMPMPFPPALFPQNGNNMNMINP